MTALTPAPFGRRAGTPVPLLTELSRTIARLTEGRPAPTHRASRRTR